MYLYFKGAPLVIPASILLVWGAVAAGGVAVNALDNEANVDVDIPEENFSYYQDGSRDSCDVISLFVTQFNEEAVNQGTLQAQLKIDRTDGQCQVLPAFAP